MKTTGLIITLVVICLTAPNVFCQIKTDDAKDIFLTEKCQRCHSITILNIENSGQKEVSDLSATGSRHKAEWLVKYLKREESLNGKKHLKNLKTSGANIEKLAKWLATLQGK